MKKIATYIIIVLIIGGVVAYFYWQSHKKSIVKNLIKKELQKSTDSLYRINYDSSIIDATNGDATFFQLKIFPDTLKKNALIKQDSLPNALYNISVEKITATGVDITGLVKKENLSAQKILLIHPILQITNTGADQPKPFTHDDTLALYKQLLGRLKRISADTIRIINGALIMVDSKGKSLTTMENMNVELHNFLVDSTKDYEHIASYFIDDIEVFIENIQFPETQNNTRINISRLNYSAAKKTLDIENIQQYKTDNTQPLIDLKQIQISNLNTDAFIRQKRLSAGIINCNGGIITVYRNAQTKQKNKPRFSFDMMDQAQIGALNLGSTKVILPDPENSTKQPLVINNLSFHATKLSDVNNGITIADMMGNANWVLSADNFSVVTKDKLYKINLTHILLDNTKSLAQIGNLAVIPLLSEKVFVQSRKHQEDRFDLTFKNIYISGVNYKKLIAEQSFDVNEVTFQPVMKIFNDRTLPIDPNSKVGKYPYQLLMKLDFPVYVKQINVKDGYVAYKERAAKSTLVGTTYFNTLNATITNFTNIPHRINVNGNCNVEATALFLGKGYLSTKWKLPLTTKNKNFYLSGSLGQMTATALNQIIEPLAMASATEGKIDRLNFDITGNDFSSSGNVLFLYHDMGIEVLKKDDENNLKTKGLSTLLANFLVKNDNPRNGETYKSQVEYQRDIHKSFFNLAWKTIFEGVKKTALGKK